ncbi:RRM domain-containing protein [Citrus sinensis]|nr:RRM domain-containing protein [Citrus sinensis]
MHVIAVRGNLIQFVKFVAQRVNKLCNLDLADSLLFSLNSCVKLILSGFVLQSVQLGKSISEILGSDCVLHSYEQIHSLRVSFSTTKEMLADAFSQFGQVTEATIIMDKGKNRSKGYGYVTFSTEEEAQKALADMNGKLLDGRVIFVDNVRPSRRYNTDAPLARQLPQSPEEN